MTILQYRGDQNSDLGLWLDKFLSDGQFGVGIKLAMEHVDQLVEISFHPVLLQILENGLEAVPHCLMWPETLRFILNLRQLLQQSRGAVMVTVTNVTVG